MGRIRWAVAVAAACLAPVAAQAAGEDEIKQIRNQIEQMKRDYEARIADLEKRLSKAEAQAEQAEQAAHKVEQNAAAAPPPVKQTRSNAFNPDVSLVLQGRYANLSQNPDTYEIGGYIPTNGEVDPGPRGLSISETELTIAAKADPYFGGQATFSISPDNDIQVENAYLYTLGLGHGLALEAGRFFSKIGYLNEQHQHAWDFIDAPLPYRAYLGGQYGDDGVQLKWVAPTDLFVELGGEALRGRQFPGSDPDKNGVGLGTLFAHVGGDVGVSQSWRAGLSYLWTSPNDRQYGDDNAAGIPVTNAFSGNSRLMIFDAVWKWAPNGNPTQRNFKLQGEYFYRHENGTLTYDIDGANIPGAYESRQSGWYAQAVYQFMPRWRVGLRYDRLNYGTVDIGQVQSGVLPEADFPVLEPYRPTLATAMVDWSPSEFSRLRLQFAQDKSRPGATDNQLFLQYILSLGAHGAHTW
jgi:hypothetical protein